MDDKEYVIYESSPYRKSDEELEIVKDFCEANDVEVPEEGSNEWYQILSDYDGQDGEWFWDQVKAFDRKAGRRVRITGRLGLWWGRPDIDPVECGSLESALHRCIGRGIQDVKAYEDEKGNFYFDCHHHDGCNCFEISGPKGGALKFAGVVHGRKYRRVKKGADHRAQAAIRPCEGEFG